MNCLSHLLNRAAREGKFGYHPKCRGLGITHLCFADDLLIFLDGSLNSLTNVLAVLDQFQQMSGLAISIQKTSLLTSGLSIELLDLITASTGLVAVSLPITYLGLPLCSKRLSILNCAPLLEKIKGRMSTWAAKTLSYAGRLQLLQSVINGISNFWCSAVVLPKKCITTINSLCSSFLWKGSIEPTHSARVAWSTITVSKSEGGLGLRDLTAWNKACNLRLIWLLFFRPASLWVAWFRRDILKDELSRFWILRPRQTFSWFTKKILKYRELIFPWIKTQIGNGKQCFFWSSNWSPFGKLKDYLADQNAVSTGIPTAATLSDLWTNGNWILPPARTDSLVNVQSFLSTISLNSEPDTFYWSPADSTHNSFATGEIYRIIKLHKPEVDWKGEIWFSGSIPRHSFHAWLVVLNRCPTRDRLLNWGLMTDPTCLLCNSCPESRNHIFFDCEFSWSIWYPITLKLSIPASHDWAENLSLLRQPQHSLARKSISLLAWQSTLYHLWTERNSRLHRSTSRTAASLLRQIDLQIRNRASSLRETRPRFASQLLQIWFAGSSEPLSQI